MKSKIIPGMRFGKLIIIERIGSDKYSNPMWSCLCDCGNKTIKRSSHLPRGAMVSCGCSVGRWKHGKWTHGKGYTKAYKSFRAMVNRCNDPKTINYKNYGGRGINICERWSGDEGFDNFFRDMGERPQGYSLDRINYDGNYEPSNCQWATFSNQSRNRHKDIFCNNLIYQHGKGFQFDLRRP